MNPARPRLIVFDALAALGFLLLPELSFLRPGTGPEVSPAVVWLLLIGTSLPLAARRRWPVTIFVVVQVFAGVALIAGVGPAVTLAPAFALYTVATTRNRPRGRTAVVVGGICVAGAVMLTVGGGRQGEGGAQAVQLVFALLVLGATWAVGTAVREQWDAGRLAIEQNAERVRIDERLRIAREIHDVVTHSVGLIAIKAGIANHLADAHPEQAREALAVIEDVSRRALSDLRVTLAMLRRPDDADPAQLHPVPGLADLPALVRTAEAAGVDVDLRCAVVGELPPGLGLSAFRIVQEAITNTVRHAAPTHCTISLASEAGRLQIKITDDGPAAGVRPAGSGDGLGLVGMRERAGAHGGTLTAGPTPNGGFLVQADLPY